MAQLRRYSNEKAKEDQAANVRQQVFNNSLKRNNLVHAVDTDAKEYWVNPETREVYDFKYGEKDASPIWRETGKRYGRGVLVTTDGTFVLRGDGKVGLSGKDLREYRKRIKTQSAYYGSDQHKKDRDASGPHGSPAFVSGIRTL